MTEQNIGTLIRKLCESKGITVRQFEEDLNYSQGYVVNMEKRNSIPSHDRMKQMSQYFGVPMSLFTGEKENPRMINVLSSVSAGYGIDAVENVIGQEEISEHMAAQGQHFALKIQGDSMSPEIHDGDIVICRAQSTAENGETVVALINGHDGVCKRYVPIKNGVMLSSNNPAYPPMFFSTSEIDTTPVVILGVVKELRRSF